MPVKKCGREDCNETYPVNSFDQQATALIGGVKYEFCSDLCMSIAVEEGMSGGSVTYQIRARQLAFRFPDRNQLEFAL